MRKMYARPVGKIARRPLYTRFKIKCSISHPSHVLQHNDIYVTL